MYKALKLLTTNKKLDFKWKPYISCSDETECSSEEDAVEILDSTDTDESKTGSDESFAFREVHEKLRKTWHYDLQSKNPVFQGSTALKVKEESSKTISTSSRSTSGPSPKFVCLEPYKSPSKELLDVIPELNIISRKACNRCLPCMYKSFEPESIKITSLPKTTLYRSIFITSNHSFSTDDSSDSATTSSTLTANELEDTLHTNATNTATFSGYMKKFSGINKIVPFVPEKESQVKTTLIQAKVESSELDRKYDAEESLLVLPQNELAPEIESSPPSDQPKVSCTLDEESTEDEDSKSVLLMNDPPKSKYLAACHAPTILRMSLEPLRALRQRQPTSMQARISLLEGTALNRDDSSDASSDEIDLKRQTNTIDECSKTVLSRKIHKNKLFDETKSTEDISLAEVVKQYLEKEKSIIECDTTITSKVKSEKEISKGPLPQHSSEFPFELPLTRNIEIFEILRKLPEERVTPMTILETLCKEFSFRLSKYVSNAREAKACKKIAIKLVELLVDSKRYLRPNQFPSDLVFSTNQPPLSNPRQLRRILPLRSYNLVAPLLGMTEHSSKKKASHQGDHLIRQSTTSVKSSTESASSLKVHPPTPRSDVSSIASKRKARGTKKLNPYALFLKKPRRKAVTWRPLTERDLLGYDPEATLDMKAKHRMRQICKEFCDWFRSLGGSDAGIDEDVLEDMFAIDFNAEVCKSLQVLLREMPTVPTEVALRRQCPDAGELAMTRTHLIADAKAERTPAKVQAFGRMIPWELRHIPPQNEVQKRWLQCEHVPRDLQTMEVIWRGITHLESVQSFVRWAKDNPEIPMPKALDRIIAMDLSCSRQAEDDEALAQRELDIEQIESFKIR